MSRPARKAHRHPGETPWLIVAGVLWCVGLALIAPMANFADKYQDHRELRYIAEYVGLVSAVIVLAPIVIVIVRALMYAQLRFNAVRITPTQFPQAYRMICEASAQMGLRRVPDAYLISGNGAINAFAASHSHRRFIGIFSDLLEVGGQARDPNALRFVIGHEVGHIAAGHTSYFRIVITSVLNLIPGLRGFLSRAQEYTADNYGYLHCPQGAAGAIAVLAAGKYLNVNVGPHEFADRATTERGFWVWLANLQGSHPVLTWRAHALRDRSRAGRLFLRPRFTPTAPGSLPPGSSRTSSMATPEEALAFLDTFPTRMPPQFGANFPVPAPGAEIHQGSPSNYGQPTLARGWGENPART